MTYINFDGSVAFNEWEYVLDIIVTNLNIYSKDIFRNNEWNFGNNGINMNDPSNVKSVIEKIIKNRCSQYNIIVNNCKGNNGKIDVDISGTFGQKSVELNFNNKNNIYTVNYL